MRTGFGELFLNPVVCWRDEDRQTDTQIGRQKSTKDSLGCQGKAGLQEVCGKRDQEDRNVLLEWSCCQGELISIRKTRARASPVLEPEEHSQESSIARSENYRNWRGGKGWGRADGL